MGEGNRVGRDSRDNLGHPGESNREVVRRRLGFGRDGDGGAGVGWVEARARAPRWS